MVKDITFDYTRADVFLGEHELEYLASRAAQAHDLLHGGTGPGNEYTGWVDLPANFDSAELNRINEIAEKIREKAEALIVIGVGGSYLGARSGIALLNHTFSNQLFGESYGGTEIYFAGHNLSSTYLSHLLDVLKDRELAVNVVSKSGTTLEPAISFRVFRKLIEERYGRKQARERIIATTDSTSGALRSLAEREGYETFSVPDDIGGRYSVLSPVGLFPLAAAGVDINEVMAGAREAYELFRERRMEDNYCYQYAVLRNLLYLKGKTIELLINYEPSLRYFAEWWKQLFGESEGKDKKGIFPASASFTTDLHSLGQYIQDGRRDLFSTTLWVEKSAASLEIPRLAENADGLNYLAGKTLHEVNEKACEGTIMAHTEGGVPGLLINIPELTPFYYGQMVYFFEKACGISGHLLGVNPFNQPGVEAYKKNMFQLLGRT